MTIAIEPHKMYLLLVGEAVGGWSCGQENEFAIYNVAGVWVLWKQ